MVYHRVRPRFCGQALESKQISEGIGECKDMGEAQRFVGTKCGAEGVDTCAACISETDRKSVV